MMQAGMYRYTNNTGLPNRVYTIGLPIKKDLKLSADAGNKNTARSKNEPSGMALPL